jgi:WD40 repeat protein
MMHRLTLLLVCLSAGTQGFGQAPPGQSADYKKEAERLQYLMAAHRMALKSRELSALDKSLQALLAQQAYVFHSRSRGYAYDHSIYLGLYSAMRSFDAAETMPLYGHKSGGVRTLVTHPSQDYILSGGGDGRILKWVYSDKQWKAETLVDQRPEVNVHSLEFSPDGRWLVSAGNATVKGGGNYAELYDLTAPGTAPKRIADYKGTIEDLTFTPDSHGFYARDNAGHSIRYAEVVSTVATEVVATQEKLHAIALSPDGATLAGVTDAGNLLLWNIPRGYAPQTIFTNKISLNALTFSPSGANLIFGDSKGILRALQLSDNRIMSTLTGHVGPIDQIVFSHSGKFMATCSKDKTVRLWNLDNLSEYPLVLDDHGDWVWSAAFTHDDRQLLVGLHGIAITLKSWPTDVDALSKSLCGYVSRNLTRAEWELYVGNHLPYEQTCPNIKK